MQQDLRALFKKNLKNEKHELAKDHEARFLERLDAQLPQKKKASYFNFKVAAVAVVLLSLGLFVFKSTTVKKAVETEVVATETDMQKGISLGDLSPSLKKVELYYVANINLELSKLEVSDENKELVDSYMQQLADLNMEYEILNEELNQMGPNEQTIAALIQNLQLRLQLLQKLKKKLNELKTSKNEQFETNAL